MVPQKMMRIMSNVGFSSCRDSAVAVAMICLATATVVDVSDHGHRRCPVLSSSCPSFPDPLFPAHRCQPVSASSASTAFYTRARSHIWRET
eukprot:1827580-Rhodomonas_salina.1